MNGPVMLHCPHGKPSLRPNEPTDSCPDCKSRKCQHGRYNMDDLGRPKIVCPECIEDQMKVIAGVPRPRK